MKIGLMFEDDVYDLQMIKSALGSAIDVDWWQSCCSLTEDELARKCRAVDVVVTGRKSPSLPSVLVEDRGCLRLLAHCHGAVKHLVSQEHLDNGLLVSNWGDQVYCVAEGALTMLLACLKQLPNLSSFVKSDWSGDQRILQRF